MSKLKKLREFAERGYDGDDSWLKFSEIKESLGPNTAHYIAAADPDLIIKLLDVVDALKKDKLAPHQCSVQEALSALGDEN